MPIRFGANEIFAMLGGNALRYLLAHGLSHTKPLRFLFFHPRFLPTGESTGQKLAQPLQDICNLCSHSNYPNTNLTK
jgi:hypothetical protein